MTSRFPLGRFIGALAGFSVALATASLHAQAPAGAKKPELPLTPARKISFTTSKASWMSLDVSPDGQSIVFDLLGDLYTLPVAGGKAERLTSGMAYDVQPRFSPDGKRVVFVSDRSGGENLWIVSLDKKDTLQITKGASDLYVSPEFTPDGQYVVASKSGSLFGAAKLWMYNVDGGSGLPLIAQPPQLKTLGAAFGPSSRYVYFAQRQGDWSYNAIFPQYQIAVYDRETGTQTTISGRHGSAFRPALSPDGKWLVYGSRHETQTGLRIRDLSTSKEEWLAYPIQRDEQESRAPMDVLPGYAFTPDSKAIIISYGGEIWRVPLDKSAPTKIPFTADVNLDAGPQVKFAYKVDDAPTVTAKQIRDAVPSPDGKSIVFSALGKLYVMDWPSGTPRRLTNLASGEFHPTWSPDGKTIAFVTWEDSVGGHIYKTAVDGKTRPVQLTTAPGYYFQPAWSPNNRIVVVRASAREFQEAPDFASSLGASADFAWISPNGGPLITISPSGNRFAPHFTSDTSRFFAYSGRDGLVSMRWDGTDIKSHLKVTGTLPPGAFIAKNATFPGTDLLDPAKLASFATHLDNDAMEPTPTPPPADVIKMSPKGDRALAKVGPDLFVVAVTQVSATPPTVSVTNPDAASVPVRKLNELAGEFPVWNQDGKRVHWSLGNAHFVYDLERAKTFDDSMKVVNKQKADSIAKAAADTTKKAPPDTAKKVAGDTAKKETPKYKPIEQRITITAPRDLPQGVAVLRGARVITMKGNEVIEDADIVIRNNRIAAVGRRGSVQVPQGAQVIDMTGKTITPGFVDTHYHTQWLIPDIHVSQVWQYIATLAYGVTTTRDPQTGSTDVLTYGDRVETGEMIGPRIYSTGPGVLWFEPPKDLEHAKNILKRYASYFDTKTLKMYMTGNRQQRQWIIIAAKENNIMPTTEGGLDFKLDMTHALDGYSGIEHALPIAPLYEDVTQMIAKTGVVNSPTLIVSYGGPFGEDYFYNYENPWEDPKLRRFTPHDHLYAKTSRRGAGIGPGPGGFFRKEQFVFPLHAKSMKDIVAAGGMVGIGAHGQLQGIGFHWEMQMMGSGGMSNHDVLKAATIFGAEAIGMGTEIGTLEMGKFADLVVMSKNPLDDIRNANSITHVMKGGRLYNGDTMDEEWPRQRKLPKYHWQNNMPVTNAGIR
ncbi:MAG TPA: amidohydrolase family protein [Gemmatimonadaceae bacterium]|nr:amidohydrolase family protein [Gemmatimonadaceae bacterium]